MINDTREPGRAELAGLAPKTRVVPAHSRPQVSDDNPFSETRFETLKYRSRPRFGVYEVRAGHDPRRRGARNKLPFRGG